MPSKFNSQRRLSIRIKLLLPFVGIIALMLLVVLPVINAIIAQRIEEEADARLSQTATSVTHLLEERQNDALLAADFVANLAEVQAIGEGLADEISAEEGLTPAVVLPPRRDQLGLQELSIYTADYVAGGRPSYYGGPPVTRRLQVSQRTTEIRDGLITAVLATGEAQSGIAIAPQSSQIIGAAPIRHDGHIHGVVLAVFYLNNQYGAEVDRILDIDLAIVRDNAVIISTLDPASGYELMLQQGFVVKGMTTARTLTYSDGTDRRLLAHPLVINTYDQGHLLVAKSIDDLLAVQEQIQTLLLAFAAVVMVGLALFAFNSIINFARPIEALAMASLRVAGGNLVERVPVPDLLFADEIVDLSMNFNAMTERLQDLYDGLEQRVAERTQDLSDAMRELALTRDKALEANRAKSVFLANMSHELRTPLNAIIGYSEMLQEEAEDFGYTDMVPDLEKIRKAGKHLLAVINDILDLSKIEAGKMELYLESFQFEDLIDEVVTTIQPMVEKNTNKMVVDAHATGIVNGDMTKLRQVIFNLLSNAAKFTKDGEVRLITRREMDGGMEWVTVQVQDTGIGMTPDQVLNVFQEFTQADASTTRKFGGTGLGLAISRHFCQMMGGTIDVTSEFGTGSLFTMRIPAQVKPSSTRTTTGEIRAVKVTTREAPAVAATSQNTVLVIDDDPEVRDLLDRTLSREGFHVIPVGTGKEGLAAARTIRPSVITLDVMMPELDGWSVLAQLKSDPELAHIPVIMLTMMDSRNLGFALGASDYLTKPIDRNHLIYTLKEQFRTIEPAGEASVLVVEDDAETRELIRRTLEKEGVWTVWEADNGRVGLQQVAQHIPSIILLDLMMPEMDGLQFIAELRKTEAWRRIPIIVITAKELTSDDRQQLNGYVERVLQKASYDREELLAEVRTLVKAYTET